MISRRRALLALLLVAPALTGCNRDSGSSIQGIVTYEGAPVKHGGITFTPVDGRGRACGAPIDEGKYKVSGVPPGKKMVGIVSVKEIHFHRTTGEAAKDTSDAPETASDMPEDAQGNNQTVEVIAGAQELNFDLKRPETGAGH